MDLVKEVEMRLEKNFPGDRWIVDFADGKHMSLEITSASFAGKGLIDQHKMVYAALADLMKDGWLHALKLKTKAQ
jgi:stress-induced morphogen